MGPCLEFDPSSLLPPSGTRQAKLTMKISLRGEDSLFKLNRNPAGRDGGYNGKVDEVRDEACDKVSLTGGSLLQT